MWRDGIFFTVNSDAPMLPHRSQRPRLPPGLVLPLSPSTLYSLLPPETALNHRSVVSLRLTAAGVRLWQASELQLTALGQAAGRCWTLAVAALPLRQLLRQPRLAVSRRLALTLRAAGRPVVGHVRVRLELGSDRDDFPAALAAEERGRRPARTRLASRPREVVESEEDGGVDGEDSEEEEEEESGPVSREDEGRLRTEPRLVSDAGREPPSTSEGTVTASTATTTDTGAKVRYTDSHSS